MITGNKRFQLQFEFNREKSTLNKYKDIIEANSLTELLAKFQLSIARFHDEQIDFLKRAAVIEQDDDIPF